MFWGRPHPNSAGDPAEFVTPIGCPNGEGIALGESKSADGAMAADGGAERAALLQLTVAQVQRAPVAVCAQPPEGPVQVPRPAVRARGLRLQPKPLGITALQRFIAAIGDLPQDGVHFRAILLCSAEQLFQAPFGSRLEQEGLSCRPAILRLRDHQLLQKMGRSAALGPAGLASCGAHEGDVGALGTAPLHGLRHPQLATERTPSGPRLSPSPVRSQYEEQGRGVHRNISDLPQGPIRP